MNKPELFRQYPNLPQLSMEQSMLILKKANLSAITISNHTGRSRVTTTKWLNGMTAGAQIASIEAVSTLAYRALRAMLQGHLPLKKINNKSAVSEMEPLADALYDKPLSEYTAQELLPPSWLGQFNLPREQDAAERIL